MSGVVVELSPSSSLYRLSPSLDSLHSLHHETEHGAFSNMLSVPCELVDSPGLCFGCLGCFGIPIHEYLLYCTVLYVPHILKPTPGHRTLPAVARAWRYECHIVRFIEGLVDLDPETTALLILTECHCVDRMPDGWLGRSVGFSIMVLGLVWPQECTTVLYVCMYIL